MSDETRPGAGDAAQGSQGSQGNDGLVPEADEIMGSASSPQAEREEKPDEAAKLRRDLEEARQATLRALAEAENVRRRAQRDVTDAKSYAIAGFARDLLNVSDNFKRALSAVADPDATDLPAELKALLDGVRMTERELNSVFERHGVTVIEPVGERFDPNKHQAMFEIENAEVASGTVLQVVQPGAVIGERVLRPAMVGVSKGGPKPGEAAKPAAVEPETTEVGETGETRDTGETASQGAAG